ncbi:MAG: hypothetical protein MMC33_004133 [Icmadophila ericetorum]|nr:hypothetical protein [Icmadophila ericetorum]
MAPALQYSVLRQNEIRVLRPTYTSNLNFELIHVPLQPNSQYSALSYTWGTQAFTHPVTINNQEFRVTQNLYEALGYLYHGYRDKPPVISKGGLLWVDAICINQNNIPERNQQVPLMKTLYEQAERIYVWLGKAENEANNELGVQKMAEFTHGFLRSASKNRPYRPWWWPNKPVPLAADIHRGVVDMSVNNKAIFDVEGSVTYRSWLAICELLHKPWWTRAWVYQEATVPDAYTSYYVRGFNVNSRNTKVLFLHGSSTFSWSDLNNTLLVAEHLQSALSVDTTLLKSIPQECRRLSKLRNLRISGEKASFLDVLQTLRLTECREPQDKVYAALGLASPEAIQNIPVDYGLSVTEVYLNVAKFSMSEAGHELDFLGYSMTRAKRLPHRSSSYEENIGLPSWVPDWADMIDIYPLPKGIHKPFESTTRQVRPIDRRGIPFRGKETEMHCYNACGDTKLSAVITGTLLCIKGVQCDSIADIMILQDVAQCREKDRQWTIQMKGQYAPTNEPLQVALARTDAADAQYDTLGRVVARNGSIDFPLLRRNKSELAAKDYERQRITRHALVRATHLRSVCLTKRGYVGLVPDSAIVGDDIYMLLGGQVLYALRPTNTGGQEFTFIGESYIHGLMDGSIMKWVTDGKANVIDLVIA